MKVKKQHVFIGLSLVIVTGGIAFLLVRIKLDQKFDPKTERLLGTLEPKFRKKVVKLLSKAKKEGIDLRVISAFRDCKEQNALYAQGRTTKGKIVTNARCGKSAHNYRIAVDVVEFKNGKPIWQNPKWERIGQIGESLGLEWGGRWKRIVDKPHFQDLGGRTIASLFKEHEGMGRLTG